MDDKTSPAAPDYAALAQRYLELWQDQVAKLAKDPQDLSAMTAAWSKMASSMAAPMATGGMYDPAAAAPRTAATAAPHGDGGVDRAGGHGGPDAADTSKQFDLRLGAIEQRLGAIESRLAVLADGQPPQPRTTGRSSGRGKKS